MRGEDALPVLAFPTPQTDPRSGPQTAPKQTSRPGRRANPDDLTRAIAALQSAEQAEQAPARRPPTTPETEQEDSFSPVGLPKAKAKPRTKPQWRAGPEQGRDVGDTGPGRVGAAAGAVTPTGTAPKPRDPLARRILSLHLPNFAMERWQREAARRGDALPEDLPQALAIEGQHGPIIHALNRAAALAGVHLGARVVDMRALVPTLKVEYADTGADRAALGRLMLWARRWCPWTALDGAAGLVMDTTGSDHLWGGEAAMLREIEGRLGSLGLSSSLAIAPTHGAAWALARMGGVREVCDAEGLALRMAPLPVRALRLDGETVLLLKRLGLKTIGELAAVPRLSLARRFSRAALPGNPLLRLDQMMGTLAEPVSAPDDPPRFAVQSALAEPVQDPTPHLPALCAELCDGMAAAGFGARRISLTIYRSDGEVSTVEAAASQPSRDPGHLMRLFDGKLDRIDPGFGFDLITLAATVAEKIIVTQTRLDGEAEAGPDLARLIDRLSARFGASALRRPAMRESHMPERREIWAPAMAGAPRRPEPGAQPRPVRLFDPAEEVRVVYAVPEGPPAQFIWRRQTHRVTRFAGPERIAPEWWADRPGTRLRDYYRVEDHHGQRFWIYREGVQEDGRGGVPAWFVHGVFA
ncbi:Y-family DNA polymerase [Flavimaricola marinus]|uniref:DNA polymerase Y-family little finger domain-containing protein n=1 Tax=Flavimaricola marinus TaxID=1819565 RepID=A0A238LHR1_9RHOB|nr:DNA polymerase Y family protein [Flavimaricola marinus]SMY09142.1 hypothetical protein LOM8899_03304 [Flavimaricola marinus]